MHKVKKWIFKDRESSHFDREELVKISGRFLMSSDLTVVSFIIAEKARAKGQEVRRRGCSERQRAKA